MRRPLVIGVTGGIGSGKSTVCRVFGEHGIPTIDTDQVAREVVLPGSEGLVAVVAEFGPGVLSADGSLDRAALRRIVFADPARRLRLEGLLHPRIRARVASLLAEVTTAYCLIGIPLLNSREGHPYLDRILVVDCPEDVQVARVMARDKLTASEVAAIMATQSSRKDRLDIADDVVSNTSDILAIRAQVEVLHHRYLELARNRRGA